MVVNLRKKESVDSEFARGYVSKFYWLVAVRLNLINHVLALFRDKFACNIALRNPGFRWESCKGSM